MLPNDDCFWIHASKKRLLSLINYSFVQKITVTQTKALTQTDRLFPYGLKDLQEEW